MLAAVHLNSPHSSWLLQERQADAARQDQGLEHRIMDMIRNGSKERDPVGQAACCAGRLPVLFNDVLALPAQIFKFKTSSRCRK
jgi:hypothetical protein